MFHPKKKKLRIPYLVSIIFPTGMWAFLCGAFGAFLILSRANFEATGTRMIFTITFPIFMVLVVLLAFVEYGFARLLGIKKEKEYIQVLNDNIIDGRLLPGLSSETIKKIFYALVKQPGEGLKVGYKYGVLIIFLTLFIEWLASEGQVINFQIIFISGLISYLLVALFGSFLAERSIYPVIKQCRITLIERDEKIKEPQFINLRRKFNYFLLIPVLVIVAIFSFIPSVDLDIIIFSCIGLIMVIIVNYMLSSSIYRAFLEVEDFAKELPKAKKVVFSTGSLNKEIVSLSESLSKAANEIYTSRKEIEERARELEKSYQEIKKRKDELERFYKLTVGRELKMVELKEEIEELKKRLTKEKNE